MATGQLRGSETASKRAADTGVLLLEFGLNKPTSERAIEAIARMNFLHSRYQKSGKITNDDLLYTLGIFALEPSRWINRYEWRSMTDLEMCACGTFWKSMGDAMEISYAKLPSSVKGWQDGLHWLQEVNEWSDAYEEAHMVPCITNRQLADAQLDYILPDCLARFREICKMAVVALLGDRLRHSMMCVVMAACVIVADTFIGIRSHLLSITKQLTGYSISESFRSVILPYLDLNA